MGLQTECWRLREELKALHTDWALMQAARNEARETARYLYRQMKWVGLVAFVSGVLVAGLVQMLVESMGR